ncbi:2,3-bisphosphoglycerate-independent phosphoglycerate mutase [Candidatus Woesearchaeota archaeon]|nr:2,3-bisphosphoglycerate-independent phosphoglycerate mutase [Candidatus Woesearchaeota archaeon]
MSKVLLVVLDGWGIAPAGKANAITQAKPLYFDSLAAKYGCTKLEAAGKSVGLTARDMGNSEVGHLHLGAGRLVQQDLVRINNSIKNGSFYKNEILTVVMNHCCLHNHTVHLLGLVSDGGVHSHLNHLLALIEMAKRFKVPQVFVHAFLDGRDVQPKSAEKYLVRVEESLRKASKNWKIASLMGRYYAMDRDNRWNREHKAYDAMVNCNGLHYDSWRDAVTAAYKRGETDEFVQPSLVAGYTCNVREGDTVIFFNFRSDRARELTKAFVQGRFNKFRRPRLIDLHFVSLTQYDAAIPAMVAFPPEQLDDTLGEVLSEHGVRQFRIAETEKWAHLTFFFNGLTGRVFHGEDRRLIPSPKVSTYDKRPQMSANPIASRLVTVLRSGRHEFVAVNFANADMVGHTGKLAPAVKAVKALDRCLKQVVPVALEKGYDVIITADHGNAEKMMYADGTPCTSHTTNKVPFMLCSKRKLQLKKGGFALYNVAPTILQLLGIARPKVMAEGMLR